MKIEVILFLYFIFIEEIKNNAKAVIPIAILVVILNFFVGVSSKLLMNFFLGCIGVIFGLAVFLTGVEISISSIGSMMGEFLGRFKSIIDVIIFGIFIGFIISVAEPDLLILANEITITVGLSPQIIVMIISLGFGILISVGLFRIFKEIKISNLMLIIYSVIFILMIFTENIGHAIAFDASGATTGAMTTPFIISLGLGVASLKGDLSEDDSFGLVGIASTGPVIAGLLMSMSIAPSEILNKFHVDKQKKEIVTALFDKENTIILFDKIKEKLKGVNTGIAFATYLDRKDYTMDYVCLYVICDRHQGQKAIHIAQENGAHGATLVHGRGSAENVKSPIFLNMAIEPEKDIVIMLIKKELEDIVKGKIYEEMELDKEGKGIIYSLPVSEVSGLVEQNK